MRLFRKDFHRNLKDPIEMSDRQRGILRNTGHAWRLLTVSQFSWTQKSSTYLQQSVPFNIGASVFFSVDLAAGERVKTDCLRCTSLRFWLWINTKWTDRSAEFSSTDA